MARVVRSGVWQSHTVAPGLQLTGIPSSSPSPRYPALPGHPHRQAGDEEPSASADHPLTISPPAIPAAHQFSPAWTYSSVALEMVLRYCQLRAARSMAHDR